MEKSNQSSLSKPAVEKKIAVQLEYPANQQPLARFSRLDNGKQVTYEVHNISKAGRRYLGLFDVTTNEKSYVGYATQSMDSDGLNVGYVATQEKYRGKKLTPLIFYCLSLVAESEGKQGSNTPILVLHPDPNVAAVWNRAGFPYQEAVDEQLAHLLAAGAIDKEGYVQGLDESEDEIMVRNKEEKAEVEQRIAKVQPHYGDKYTITVKIPVLAYVQAPASHIKTVSEAAYKAAGWTLIAASSSSSKK